MVTGTDSPSLPDMGAAPHCSEGPLFGRRLGSNLANSSTRQFVPYRRKSVSLLGLCRAVWFSYPVLRLSCVPLDAFAWLTGSVARANGYIARELERSGV